MPKKENKFRSENSELLKADNKSLLSTNQVNNLNGSYLQKKTNSNIISNEFYYSNNDFDKKIYFEYSLNKI